MEGREGVKTCERGCQQKDAKCARWEWRELRGKGGEGVEKIYSPINPGPKYPCNTPNVGCMVNGSYPMSKTATTYGIRLCATQGARL